MEDDRRVDGVGCALAVFALMISLLVVLLVIYAFAALLVAVTP